VRQTAPLAPALHLGARAVLAISLRNPARLRSDLRADEYPAAAIVLGQVFDSVFLDALDADVEHLERVNTLLRLIPRGVPPPGGLRTVSLLVVRPSRDLGVLALQHAAGLPRRVRWIVGRLGGRRTGSHDFLSYLLFEPSYTSALVELGQEDVNANWPAFEGFFEKLERADDERGLP
jgi:NTE family protein